MKIHMKIEMLSNSVVPSRSANSVQVMKMADAFTRLGHAVRLWTIAESRDAFWRKPETFLSQSSELKDRYDVSHSFSIVRVFIFRGGYYLDYFFRVMRQMRRADLIFTRHIWLACFSAWLKRPTILEMHTPNFGKVSAWLLARPRSQKYIKKVIVISEGVARGLRHHARLTPYLSRLQVEHDGVDLEKFLPWVPREKKIELRHALSMARDAKIALYCGHLYRGRGIELIIEVAKNLPEYLFYIVGGTDVDLTHWRTQIDAQKINNLIFTGFVDNAQVPLYLCAADALLMPYQKKVSVSGNVGDTAAWMSPLKLFEYMASGRPVISSDLPAIREVLNDDEVIFCPPDSPQAWILALKNIFMRAETAEARAEKSLNKVLEYSWTKRAARILAGTIK